MLLMITLKHGSSAEEISTTDDELNDIVTAEANVDEEDDLDLDPSDDGDDDLGNEPPPIIESGELFPIGATKKVTENSTLEMYVDEESGNIRIVNKETDREWLGAPQLDTATLPNNVKFMESPVHIAYTDGSSVSQTYSLKEADNEVTISEIENGVRADFTIEELTVQFALEYTLLDDGFEVTIPDDSIKEEGSVRITSLEVLPFFNALAQKEDSGAVFVPDGSGALMKVRSTHPQYFTGYSEPVYGPDHSIKDDLGEVMADGFMKADAPKEKVALPVYGTYQNDKGFLAIITEGQEAAKINANPGGIRNIPYYHASSEFIYRNQDIVFIGSSGRIPLFQGNRIDIDRTVKYVLLEEDEADYVGMAKTYRNYLQETAGLEEKGEVKTPLHVELVGGLLRDEIIGSTFIDMTTFEQAEEIITNYADKGIDSLKITFKGWTKDGLYGNQPKHFPVERKLGGKKDLEKLVEHAKDQGVELYLDANYVRPFHGSSSISARKDAVRGIDREVLISENYHVSSRINNNLEQFNLLTPESILKYTSREISDYQKIGVEGLHLSHMGELLYSNYNPKSLTHRKETKEAMIEGMEELSESIGKLSVDYGFSYALGYVDEIHRMPLDSSHFVYLDETVPFYQIAVHGLVPYTGKPANLRSDAQNDLLRAIEYGAFPSFEITYKSTENLKRTMEDRLFSSSYSYWFDESLAEYERFQEIFEETEGSMIQDHEQIDRNVYKTTYENGTAVIVNYNRKSKLIDDTFIEGRDYVITKEGRQ